MNRFWEFPAALCASLNFISVVTNPLNLPAVTALSTARTPLYKRPVKPAELNGARAEKKTGLSVGGSTLIAVGAQPAGVHRVCFPHSKGGGGGYIASLALRHTSLSGRNVRRSHMTGSNIKGVIVAAERLPACRPASYTGT